MIRLVRRRYIAFKLDNISASAPPVSKRELLRMLENDVKAICGGQGLEQHYIKIITYDQNTSMGIIRCGHKAVDFLHSIFRGHNTISRYKIKTIGTSGSIKGLKRKFGARL